MTALLSVKKLKVKFQSDASEIIAVDGTNFEINIFCCIVLYWFVNVPKKYLFLHTNNI